MIIDHIRDLEEFRTLYDSRPMPEPYDFDFLVNNPNLFCFYDNDKLKGFITVQRENQKLTLSGVSARKNMPNVINAIVKICDSFDEDMYAYTPLKEAKLVLLKAGFLPISSMSKSLKSRYLTCYRRSKRSVIPNLF